MKNVKSSAQSGFTIIELMIATLVFTVILLIITTAVLRFSAAYYRTVRVTGTQETTRSVVDTVSRAIQLGSGTVTTGGFFSPPTGMSTVAVKYFCAGGKVFAYQAGPAYQAGSSLGLVMEDANTSCSYTTADTPSLATGQQLLPKGTRLVQLEIIPADGAALKRISVVMASADYDLLCDNRVGGCGVINEGNDAAVANAGTDLRCKSGVGSEYCAVSKTSTIVGKRL